MHTVPIRLRETAGLSRSGEAVRLGVPVGRGLHRAGDGAALRDAAGKTIGCATAPLAWWDDGSVKWLLVDFRAGMGADSVAAYTLHLGDVAPPPAGGVRLVRDAATCDVDTGVLRLTARVSEDGTRACLQVEVDGCHWSIDPLGANLSADTQAWSTSLRSAQLSVERESPMRVVLCLGADLHLPDGGRLGRVRCRVHCVAGSSALHLDHTYIHLSDIRHRHLTDAGVLVRCDGELKGQRRTRYGVDDQTRSTALASDTDSCRLFQYNADRPRPLGFDQFDPAVCRALGYASRGPEGERVGARLDGWACVTDDEVGLTVAVEDLWQQYPKELILGRATAVKLICVDRLEDGELDVDWCVGIRPQDVSPTGAPWACWGEDGIAKSHRVLLDFHPAAHLEEAMTRAQAFLAPLAAGVPPEYLCRTGALGKLAPANPESFPQTEAVLQRQVEWLWRHQTEWSNWYGMMNWGGVQTHYLPVEERWTNLIERYGWINGEAEPQLAVLYQFLRTGDGRWGRMAAAMVHHLADVDTVQEGERAGYMRRHFAVHFGQPGDMSHTFLGPVCLHYFLTGDERVREVIEQVAATSMSFFNAGWHRDSTDAMKNCLWYYEMSRDEEYLQHAERIRAGIFSHLNNAGGVGVPLDTGFHTNCYLLSAVLLYERMFGGEAVRDDVLRVVDYGITPRGRSDDASVSRGISYEGLAFAYRHTGDDRYLIAGIRDLAMLWFSRVYQTFTPTVRFPSAVTQYYRPPSGEVRPDSFSSIHWFGRYLTMIPLFLDALRQAGIEEHDLPVDAGVCGVGAPHVRTLPPEPAEPTLAWDSPRHGSPDLPGNASPGARFTPLDLGRILNAAPLALDPFSYTDEAMRAPQTVGAAEWATTGSIHDHLVGLPWGAQALFGGVPFQLADCRGSDDPGMLVLHAGSCLEVPIDRPVERLHLLGQTSTRGDLIAGTVGAVYRLHFADGTVEQVEQRNLVHYDDWRDLHYATEASLACAWYPKAFDLMQADPRGLAASGMPYFANEFELDSEGEPQLKDDPNGLLPPIRVEDGPHAGTYYYLSYRSHRMRHLNQLAIDLGGRQVRSIELIDGGTGHDLLLLAMTAEVADDRTMASRRVSWDGTGSHDALEWQLTPRMQATGSDDFPGAQFDGSASLRLRTGRGRHRLTLTLAGGPVIVDVRVGGQPITQGWHLLGHWCRDWPDPPQSIRFEAAAAGEWMDIDLDVDPGLLYERTLNHHGGNGWVWRGTDVGWERRVPEPWRLVSAVAEPCED